MILSFDFFFRKIQFISCRTRADPYKQGLQVFDIYCIIYEDNTEIYFD